MKKLTFIWVFLMLILKSNCQTQTSGFLPEDNMNNKVPNGNGLILGVPEKVGIIESNLPVFLENSAGLWETYVTLVCITSKEGVNGYFTVRKGTRAGSYALFLTEEQKERVKEIIATGDIPVIIGGADQTWYKWAANVVREKAKEEMLILVENRIKNLTDSLIEGIKVRKNKREIKRLEMIKEEKEILIEKRIQRFESYLNTRRGTLFIVGGVISLSEFKNKMIFKR